jgi:hypothetical protein
MLRKAGHPAMFGGNEEKAYLWGIYAASGVVLSENSALGITLLLPHW